MIFQFPASVWPLTSHISHHAVCTFMPRCYCNSKYNTKPPIIPTFLKKCTNSLSNSVGKIAMERSAKAGNLTFFGTALVQRPTFMTNVQWQVSTVDPTQKTTMSAHEQSPLQHGVRNNTSASQHEKGGRVCRGFPRQWHGSTPQGCVPNHPVCTEAAIKTFYHLLL